MASNPRPSTFRLDTRQMRRIRRGLELQERFPLGAKVQYTAVPENGGEAHPPEGGEGTVVGHTPERVHVNYPENRGDSTATKPENLDLLEDGTETE